MSTLVYLAEPNPLLGATLRDELARETGFDFRCFTSLPALRKTCAERMPNAVLASCRQTLPEALPFLQSLDPRVVGMAMTEGTDAAAQEALSALGPLHVTPLPWQRLDLLPKLQAALERQRLARDLVRAREELWQRDLALRASRKYVDRTNEELQVQHDVLETATARLVEAEQLAAVGRVVGGIAHEIENQLALVGYAEAIKSRVDEDSELYEFADAIAVAQKRLATMVDQIRSFTASEPDASLFEPASLSAAVDEALAILRYDQDVRARNLRRRYLAQPLVLLKREQFAQVVINLVSNAVYATSPGDTINIELSEDLEVGTATLTIQDEGQGMGSEVLERLGEPFFTTRGAQGSGLGIGICMSIARAHGGSIGYVSDLGVGTTASVCLPLFVEEGA